MAREIDMLSVAMGFEKSSRRISVADIQPLRLITASIKRTSKYAQIVASIEEVGIIEPPVVARDRTAQGKYLMLDGHLRLEALKDRGATDVVCLVSTDDEAFTYNKRVSRLAIVQEHRMILKAIERGASEDRIVKALNIDIRTLRQKKRLLSGICPEVAELLKDKHVPLATFDILKKMTPLRQIEATELMIAMNKYAINYARSLLAATPSDQLMMTDKPKAVPGLTAQQMAMMEHESANLDREFRMAEQSYSADHLDLVLAKGYLTKLLGNARVVRYLAQYHQDILAELQKITEMESTAT